MMKKLLVCLHYLISLKVGFYMQNELFFNSITPSKLDTHVCIVMSSGAIQNSRYSMQKRNSYLETSK